MLKDFMGEERRVAGWTEEKLTSSAAAAEVPAALMGSSSWDGFLSCPQLRQGAGPVYPRASQLLAA